MNLILSLYHSRVDATVDVQVPAARLGRVTYTMSRVHTKMANEALTGLA